MGVLHDLVFGLGVAVTWQNLLYCFVGCVLGTLVGRAAGHRAGSDGRHAAAVHLQARADPGADHARRHLLRRPVWRVDHRDPRQHPRRGVLGGDDARRLPDGAARSRRPGARHRRDRLVLRRLRRHRVDRAVRPAARRHRAQVQPGGIFLADGVRPRRRDRAGARLARQGARHGVRRPAVRDGRHRRQFRGDPLRLRPARARRRPRLRRPRHGVLRHDRRRHQPGEPGTEGRVRQPDRQRAAEPFRPAHELLVDHPRHRPRLDPRHPARRRGAARLVCRLHAGEKDRQAAAALRRGRYPRRGGPGKRQQCRRPDLLHPDADARHSIEPDDGADDRRADDPGHRRPARK